MATQTEVTFGAKLANGKTLLNHLKTYTDYQSPRESESVSAIETLLGLTKAANDTAAGDLQTYALVVDARQKCFDNIPGSLKKMLSPIYSAVRSQYGKTSREVSSIGTMVNSMRGEALKKDPKNPDDKSSSTAQQSYASMTQSFSDLVASLKKLEPAYNPANNAVKLPQLEEKADDLEIANTHVTNALRDIQKARTIRTSLYTDLNDRTQRIKDAVKSQYGVASNEYKLIKGLKI